MRDLTGRGWDVTPCPPMYEPPGMADFDIDCRVCGVWIGALVVHTVEDDRCGPCQEAKRTKPHPRRKDAPKAAGRTPEREAARDEWRVSLYKQKNTRDAA